MLVCESPSAIAHGAGRAESSVSIDNEGDQVVECLVERSVLLPGGQGIKIPPVVEQVVSADFGLGKRKAANDLEDVEIRLKTLQCDNLQIEQKQMQKQFDIDNETKIINNNQKIMDNEFANVNNFVHAMQLLDPLWRNDKGVVLQATDYMKNRIFNGCWTQQIKYAPEESE